MARKIDFDNLSKEDLHYLSQRAHLVKEAELQGYSDIRDKIAAVDSEEEETGGHTDYNSATVPQLREELKSRGLDTDGNKDALVARLEEDDEEEDDEEEE